MKYTDPDGEVVIIPAIMIGFFVGAMTTGYEGGTPGQIMGGALIGGAAGGLGAGVGGAVAGSLGFGGFGGGVVSGAASGFTSGFFGSSGNAWMRGASFSEGLMAGVKSGGWGAAAGGLIGGTVAGIDAYRSGANFWTGRVNEVGGYDGPGRFLEEEIPAGAKPTEKGEIAKTGNPKYGKYGWTRTDHHGNAKPHFGVDYAGNEGDPVSAMYEGRVTKVGLGRVC